MCKISIITINKNNSEGLQRTIRSVIDQTFSDYEFIVIDGGSTDDSCSVIEQHKKQISYWVSETDNGIYQAMNKGIAKASGEYVIFMNSGDHFLSSDIVSKVFSNNRTSDFLVAKAIIEGKWMRFRTYLPKEVSFYALGKHPVCHQATFTKRILFDELGKYDETLQISADWKFLLTAFFLNNKTIDIIDQDIALLEPNGISAKDESAKTILKEREYIFNTYFRHLYEGYVKENKKKRYSFANIKMHLIWHLNQFLNNE